MRGNTTTEAVKPSGMRSRRGRGIAAAVGLVACSALVWQSSHATFTATTVNNNNVIGAGTVNLSDDDNNNTTVMFNSANMAPGTSVTSCIAVTNTGSLPLAGLKMYLPQSAASESNAGGSYQAWANTAFSEFDDNATLRIEENTVDLSSDPGINVCTPTGYTGFTDVTAATAPTLQSLISTTQNYATTSLTATPMAPAAWRVFRFTITLPSTAGDTVQGDGLKFGVTWEGQK